MKRRKDSQIDTSTEEEKTLLACSTDIFFSIGRVRDCIQPRRDVARFQPRVLLQSKHRVMAGQRHQSPGYRFAEPPLRRETRPKNRKRMLLAHTSGYSIFHRLDSSIAIPRRRFKVTRVSLSASTFTSLSGRGVALAIKSRLDS